MNGHLLGWVLNLLMSLAHHTKGGNTTTPVKVFAKGQGRGQHPLKRPGEARGTGRPCEGADHPPNTTVQRKKEFLWHHQGGEEGW